MEKQQIKTKKKINTRALSATAMLSALSYALMFIEFSVPIIPSFIKFDLSELPALIAAFAYGPTSGIMVCLVKNLINLLIKSSTGGIGELSNFLLGALFVVPAGLIYKIKKTRVSAAIGSLAGAIISAFACFFTNYYVVYPIYIKRIMSADAILGMYKAILPSVNSLRDAILIFNVPFTFVKFLIVSVITFLIYKRISPILKGKI